MKRIITTAFLLLLSLSLIACTGSAASSSASSSASASASASADSSSSASASSSFQTVGGTGYAFEMDQTWVKEALSANAYMCYPEGKKDVGPFLFIEERRGYTNLTAQADQIAYLKELYSKPAVNDRGSQRIRIEYSNIREATFGSNAMIIADYDYYLNDALDSKGTVVQFFVGADYMVCISYDVAPDAFSAQKSDIDRLVNSIKPA